MLEYADVGTLYQRIEVGRMGEREAACLFRQLVCAVAYLHRRGILHRDIKPENVFLARDPVTVRRGAWQQQRDLGTLRRPVAAGCCTWKLRHTPRSALRSATRAPDPPRTRPS